MGDRGKWLQWSLLDVFHEKWATPHGKCVFMTSRAGSKRVCSATSTPGLQGKKSLRPPFDIVTGEAQRFNSRVSSQNISWWRLCQIWSWGKSWRTAGARRLCCGRSGRRRSCMEPHLWTEKVHVEDVHWAFNLRRVWNSGERKILMSHSVHCCPSVLLNWALGTTTGAAHLAADMHPITHRGTQR